jgi:hypothetical protein
MLPKYTIKANEIVSDIRSGMTNRELMDKYRVSEDSLRNLLRKLVVMRAIQTSEVQALLASSPQELIFHDRRKEQRYDVFVELPIYDMDNLLDDGQVLDISGKGLRVAGLSTYVGNKKDFLIQPDHFVNVLPFVFEAECVWVSQIKGEPGIAGLKITHISRRSLEELEKIIRALTIRKYSQIHLV